jgi:hypothetical protein
MEHPVFWGSYASLKLTLSTESNSSIHLDKKGDTNTAILYYICIILFPVAAEEIQASGFCFYKIFQDLAFQLFY